jgi:hypothetical protein
MLLGDGWMMATLATKYFKIEFKIIYKIIYKNY